MKAVLGDITKLKVDVIVNAANSSLLGGGGVDGAIHRAAGSKLLEECRLLGRCKTGESKITKGYLLPARYIIHTVGPVWQGGNYGESILLQKCYESAMKLALKEGLRSIAFPCISTGRYGFPKAIAASTAFKISKKFLVEKKLNDYQVIFCCYEASDFKIYSKLLSS
jgi:O-acetyl-ADP-ribose deacetylase (regulator of RNase III)